ncbi:hypothetical protein C8J56DRAFT_1058029 [Mycena floridula]|nr:hypothetical protein C8J56DRAFT_1058029 [Mycena floridula]
MDPHLSAAMGLLDLAVDSLYVDQGLSGETLTLDTAAASLAVLEMSNDVPLEPQEQCYTVAGQQWFPQGDGTTESQPTFEHSTEQEDTPDLTEFSLNTLTHSTTLCSTSGWVYYPQSPIWRLVKTNKYLIGCCYKANLNILSEAIEADQEHMINLELPPEIDAIETEDMFVHRPVPGMVKMIPGIPFRWQVVGGPRDDEIARYVFGGCVMMLKSIQNLHPHIYEQVYALAKELHLLALEASIQRENWSNLSIHLTISNIMTGTKRKLLVFICGVMGDEFLQELTMLMMPRSISKHQWEMTTFHLEDNNSFSFGGLQPGPIALQINISSILNAKGFFEAFGAIQSMIHGEDGDDTTMATNFHLIYHLPPFSDPGTFILCRMGSYVEETDSWYLKLDPDWWLHDKTLVAINTEWRDAQFVTCIGNVTYVPVQASQPANNLLQMIEFKDPQSGEVYLPCPMTYDSAWN